MRSLIVGPTLVGLVVTPVFLTPSAAADEAPAATASLLGVSRTYQGPALPDRREYRDTSATETESQSKLWFHDGSWWAVLPRPDGDVGVSRLEPDHTWVSTATSVGRPGDRAADVLLDGGDLFVLTRAPEGPLRLTALSYDDDARKWQKQSGFPVLVAERGSRSATLARDSAGRLWSAVRSRPAVEVAYSDPSGRTWSEPYAPDVRGTALAIGETSAIVSFDEAVGVMWSDQRTGRFTFAVHRDADPVGNWSREVALEGPRSADDHISLAVVRRAGADVVLAAVKTSANDTPQRPDAPLVSVLRRNADGWSATTAGTVVDDHSRPMILATDTEQVLVLAQSPQPGGVIYLKSAPLQDLDFPSGRGTPLVVGAGRVRSPTSTKQTLTVETGLVVMATGGRLGRLLHAEQVLLAPRTRDVVRVAGDQEPPTVPGLPNVSRDGDDITLTWHPSRDGMSWSPASPPGRPVHHYTVYRDGEPVGTPDQATFVDDAGGVPGRPTYAVDAVDATGNHSARTEPVRAPAKAAMQPFTGSPAVTAGIAALAGALLVGVAVMVSRRLRGEA